MSLPRSERGHATGHAFLKRLRNRISGFPRNYKELNRSLQLLATLRSLGWQKSFSLPVAHNGTALPWYPYPAIEWIQKRLATTDQVFEFGAGHSTLWYAAHVRSVKSVDHDLTWVTFLSDSLPMNALVNHAPITGDWLWSNEGKSPYVSSITSQGTKFDLIIVDGMERCSCLYEALGFIRESGAIVLDNSDRYGFQSAFKELSDRGFYRIDFSGFPPGLGQITTTSVFFKDPSRWLTEEVCPKTAG